MQQEIWFQKYKILGLIGSGGTAKVYLAEHIKLNSYRAIKFISKNHPLYILLRNEAFLLKNLKHPSIPIIYDIEEDEEGSYIIEQYLEGATLKDFVLIKGFLNDDIIIQFGLQLCDLIQYLHSVARPILYLDLKPDNIIVCGSSLKLVDFGSALYQDEISSNQPYTGTRGYAAPELYGTDKIDERCDVYGIGMLLYFMASGIFHKTEDKDIHNIDQVSGCSKQIKNIINKCLKFHASQRYASVSTLYLKLSAIKKKNQYNKTDKAVITYAIAGAQHRIGVTHFALRFCHYLLEQKLKCLYQECNDTGCIRIIRNRYEETKEESGLYYIQKIPLLQSNREAIINYREYDIVIKDFGKLTQGKLDEYLNADIRLLLLGFKDWELNDSEEALNIVTEYKEIFYLFNFINGKQFQQAVKNMENRRCYRIPYEPDPFSKITVQNGKDFFQDMLHLSKDI